MASQDTMNLLQFVQRFATEDACEAHLFVLKWPQGFRCANCEHEKYYAIKTRRLTLFECKACGYQTTVTVRTIMEKSHTSLNKWFVAIFLAAHDKRGVSATLIAREVDVSYKTAWLMLHKIRKAMANRDAAYQLAGIVELDESYFGAPAEGGKRGRGTDKAKVVIGLSLNKQGHPLFVKMQVVADLTGATLLDFTKKCIKPGTVIHSDGFRSYNALVEPDYTHRPLAFDLKKHPDHLKWLHTILSNAKAFIAGTYHGLDTKHLPAYLNEFSYRFNRRRFKGEQFNRLLHCCCLSRSITFSELTA